MYRRMIAAGVGVAVFALGMMIGLGVVDAQEAAPPPGLPPLDGVQWAGPRISFDMLKGKTAVVLVYATWCPKCNAWSGELFQQLKTATSDKPVVILAINADESPAGVNQYLAERGFFGPNIFHGYDRAMHVKLGFESNLYNYVSVGPDGAISGRGSAGGFFDSPQGKRFALPSRLSEAQNLGSFQFVAPGMSPELKALFWPWELGAISESALKSAHGKFTPDQRKEADAAVARYLDAKLETIRANYKGEMPERIEAYEAAVELSGIFRSTPQNEKAREVVKFMDQDAVFKREVAAKKAYDGAMARIAENPKRKTLLLGSVAQRFEETHFGKLAAEALSDK